MEIMSAYNKGIEALSVFIEHVISWEIRDRDGITSAPHLEGTMICVPGSSDRLYFYPVSPKVIRTCRINGSGKIVENLGEYHDTGAVAGGAHAYIAHMLTDDLNAATVAA